MDALKAFVLLGAVVTAIMVPGSALAAPPANDQFAAATELVGQSDVAAGTNAEATKETGEPAHAGNLGGASIWYRWTAPAGGRVVVSTCGSGFDTLLGVYTGTAVGSLTQVAANNDGCGQGQLQSRLSFQATTATTYHIAVDGSNGATGVVDLMLDVPPANDDFAAGRTLSGEVGSVDGTNIGATNEPGEPVFGRRSVWFNWTAPSSGRVMFETCASDFDTMLAAYTGSAVDQLTGITGNDDYDEDCGYGSRIDFVASAGTVYRIALSGYDREEAGNYVLSWVLGAPAPILYPVVNGLAVDGETLTATDGTWSGTGPFEYSYAWGRCDREVVECAFISGATSKTFTIRSVDVGFRLWVRVTASNAVGSAHAFADVTEIVRARAPSNRASPIVDGEGRLGEILVASPGDWTGTAPITYAYQWQNCDATESSCFDIPGQTGQIMRAFGVEAGDVVRVVVTATNVAGSASAASPGLEIEQAVQTRCVVPRLRGQTLRSARASIRRNHCRLGRVQRRFSNGVAVGRVISQTPRAGRRLAAGTRVHLVLSKGKRR